MASNPSLPPLSVNEGPDMFRAAMGRHFASVCLISTCVADEPYGLTATAVSSVSAEPPRLLVCINRSGGTQAAIREAGFFCVNILSEDQKDMAALFAGRSREARRACFDRPGWHSLITGAPVHSQATAAIDCRVAEAFDRDSHTIFIGNVVAAQEPCTGSPLLYGRQGFHRLGTGAH